MKNRYYLEENFETFLETSSVLTHDISGQSHVAQFCLEELAPFIGPDGQKFISKLRSSLEEISEMTCLYRQIVKLQNSNHPLSSLKLVQGSVESLIHLHYFKDRELLKCEISDLDGLWDKEAHFNKHEIQSILYASFAIFLEGLKLSILSTQAVNLSATKENSDIRLFLNVAGTQEQLFELQKLVEDNGPYVGKALRRASSMSVFKKALKGRQEAVKIDFINLNQRIGLEITLKQAVAP